MLIISIGLDNPCFTGVDPGDRDDSSDNITILVHHVLEER